MITEGDKELIAGILKILGITQAEMRSKCRKENLVVARTIVAAAVIENLSLTETGKVINRDHASVLHALSSFEARYKFEKPFKHVVDEVDSKFQTGLKRFRYQTKKVYTKSSCFED